jgi:iron complex outermembrane recepter protein
MLVLGGVACGATLAAPPPPPAEDATLVVTATRVAQSSLDLPVSVDRIGAAELHRGQPQVNLSETLNEVPGVSAINRQNYAQDLQLSVRGFGARSSFGVRGVRLYADGIPATTPDGQGQFSNFDLPSAGRIEVLRGPFSALYGNSSGGVIALFTADGKPGTELAASALLGSQDQRRYGLLGSGEEGRVNFMADVAAFTTDGYRAHSAAERDTANAKVRITLDERSSLTLIGNAIKSPYLEDPLGLSRAQLGDPSQAGTGAVTFNTRKALDQLQAGAVYEREFSAADSLSALFYAGHRDTTQYQAIPRQTQSKPASPGGVIDLGRNYAGTDVHLTDRREIGAGPLQLTAGVAYDDLMEARRGYLNYAGASLGVQGALRRDLANHVYDLDEYFEAVWDPTPRLKAMAGIRHSSIVVASRDHLAAAGTDPASGVRYDATDPVAGLTWRANEALNLYVSYGRGFETPTLNDLAYRSTDGSLPGLNLALRPARSDNYEVGVKFSAAPADLLTLAAFAVRTRDELAVAQNSGGRSVFENIGATRRDGAELSLVHSFGANLSTRLAYSYLRALTVDAYTSCATLPCKPTTIAGGSRLPAVPANSIYASLQWDAPFGLHAVLEAIGRSQIYVDDRNSDAAPGYWQVNLRLGLEQRSANWRLSEYLRIENLADRAIIGSVIVNDANGRFFEPDPGRSFYLLLSAAYR